MANQNGLARDYLNELMSSPDKLFEYGFTPLMRHLDASSDSPYRLGYSISPKYDVCRFGQSAMLKFFPSAFVDVTYSRNISAFKVNNSYFGLFGCYGPLPSHLTEYAIERSEQYKDSSFTAFADVFHHRLITLFYRAWADSEPVVGLDRSDDRFSFFLQAISGAAGDRSSNLNKLQQSFAGLHSYKNKSKGALKQILSSFLHLPVYIEEFSGAWYEIESGERSELGAATSLLGRNAIAGKRTFQRSYCFTVIIGPLNFEEYISFFSNDALFDTCRKICESFIGSEFDVRFSLVLKACQRKPTQLGKTALGQTSWLLSGSESAYKKETVLAYRN